MQSRTSEKDIRILREEMGSFLHLVQSLREVPLFLKLAVQFKDCLSVERLRTRGPSGKTQ